MAVSLRAVVLITQLGHSPDPQRHVDSRNKSTAISRKRSRAAMSSDLIEAFASAPAVEANLVAAETQRKNWTSRPFFAVNRNEP